MNCPKCNTPMQPTYWPYEDRCPNCGLWWDEWVGKEIDPLGDQVCDQDESGEDWVSQCQNPPNEVE